MTTSRSHESTALAVVTNPTSPELADWSCQRSGHRWTEFYSAAEMVDLCGDHGGPTVACGECGAQRSARNLPDSFWWPR